MTTPAAPSRVLRSILAAIAFAAILLPALAVRYAPAMPRHVAVVVRPQRVVPAVELPAVEPVRLQDLDPEDARRFNATVPFSVAANPAARPYRMAGAPEEIARATDCLAAGVYYEAGDDAIGQRAVAQVVLNRLHHPAFPKSVCSVVFQGAERRTGCQFTFTCDGAIARYTPSEIAWSRARAVATAALTGTVYKPVGYATHYHTDWVVPYWSASLDKIAEVHTHLFFRWTGWWGTPPAFRRQPMAVEPTIPVLARISPVHGMALALDEAGAAMADAAMIGDGSLQPLPGEPDTFVTRLDAMNSGSFAALAAAACVKRARCKFMGWTAAAAVPTAPALTPEQLAAMSFSYLRDTTAGIERMLWNCTEFPHPDARDCMRRQTLRVAAPAPRASPSPAASPTPRGPETLDGVHRRTDQPAPTPSPSPTPTGR